MPRRIDISQARALLRSRAQLRDEGLTERDIPRLIAEGRLLRVHRGSYADAAQWRELWPEGRQLVRTLAVRSASTGEGPIFSHLSAAALWGLPLYGVGMDQVHTVIGGARHSRTTAGVIRHAVPVDNDDVTVRGGVRCTSLARTVLDVARSQRLETAVTCADAAMRMRAVAAHEKDTDAAERWLDELAMRSHSGLRGIRQARWVTAFADGRAQLPGESVSRLRLHQLGYRNVDLQTHVVGSGGNNYWLDFAFVRARIFGEFDGQGKYLDADLRGAMSTEEAVLREKRREDDIRGVTGWRIVRWEHEHIRTPDALGARLRAFGLRPPG